MPRAKSARLNLRLDPDLIQGMRDYARRRGLSLTSLIELHFREVLQAQAVADTMPIDAEQV